MAQAQYVRFYNEEAPERWGRAEMRQEFATTREWLARTGCDRSQAIVVELGCGVGALSDMHPNYIGLDLSLGALRRFGRKLPRVNASMESLPFKDQSVNFLFSWAALEHVPHPERVLLEIERVLARQGVLLLAPAWNVRSWAAKALPVRKYRELGLTDRLAKASIPIRNSVLWRALAATPRRLQRELMLSANRPMSFDYRRLHPRMDSYVYTDCDAFTSMDAHAALCYFASRKWQVLSHNSLRSRFLVRHEPIVVRKP
jgi:ubiquinone/menaquinone biosynthesis C-methylase UbiE